MLIDMTSELSDLVPALGRVRARKLINRALRGARKLAMQGHYKFFVLHNRFFKGCANGSVILTPILVSPAPPPIEAFIKVHSFVAGCIVAILPAIELILGKGRYAQILAPIVESVAIFMIWNGPTGGVKNDVMHPDYLPPISSGLMSAGVDGIALGVIMGVPVPLIKELVNICVNFCVLVLSERDKAVRLIKRLNNLVTIHGELHDSTSNGILRQFGRISIVSGGSLWHSWI